MRASSKSVTETLVAIDGQRIPNARLRGLKPSAVRFVFAQHLVADYRGFGVLLTPAGVAAVREARADWHPVMRGKADAT